MHKSLIELDLKEEAEVVSFNGSHLMNRRLEGLGIRQGKKIFRISSQFIRGPVIVSVDGHQAAMGRGMAAKLIVKPVNTNGV
jgi:Fe2+ transport system protein FeoA